MTRCLACVVALLTATTLLAQDAKTEPAKKDAPMPEAKSAQTSDAAGNPRVKLETSLGDIVLELDAQKAPISTENFIQYCEDKHYDGLIFHRVMSTFMIQGGGYKPDLSEKREGLRKGITNEWQNGLKNARGTIAMARLGNQPNSATAQFFINVVDNGALDVPRDGAGYAVFGKVVEGMDVVDKIKDTPVKEDSKLPMGKVVPETPVVIKSARLVTAFDKDKLPHRALGKEFKDTVEKMQDAQGRKITRTDSGLMYIVLKEGSGPTPQPNGKVEAHYTGWLMDGMKFDSSVDRGKPLNFAVKAGPPDGVIQGWVEAFGGMKVGEKRRLFIPGNLGYGPGGNPRANIPGDAMLVFDAELLAIK